MFYWIPASMQHLGSRFRSKILWRENIDPNAWKSCLIAFNKIALTNQKTVLYFHNINDDIFYSFMKWNFFDNAKRRYEEEKQLSQKVT